MNKIVIVGHPQSGYQEVEHLLNACGMATAQPSRREGFLPEHISSTLCKVHSAPALNQVITADQIQQIEAGAVWHGMALDLMLGNLDQPIWGWADPQAIYLLNYWRDLDPNITFILVYDRPHSVLTEAAPQDVAGLSHQELSQRTTQWAAYNAALLHFYHRNAKRCLLVHSQQVRESASGYLQQVRSRINAPWPESMVQLAAPKELQSLEAPPAETISASPSDVVKADAEDGAFHSHPRSNQELATVSKAEGEHQQVQPGSQGDPQTLALFIADALLRQQPDSLQLYEELQAVANLPLADGVDTVLHGQSALQAWCTLNAERVHLQQQHRLVDQLHQTQAEAEAALAWTSTERDRARAEHARAEKRSEALKQQVDELQLQLAEYTATVQENELLLTQLHRVQEELERHLKENQTLAQQVQSLQQARQLGAQELAKQQQALETAAAQHRKDAEQLRQQLKAATEAPKVDLALEQENELLLTQLHMVQEELERHFLEGQEKAKRVEALQLVEQQSSSLQQRINDLETELEKAQAARTAQPLSAEAAQMIAQLLQAQEAEERHFHNGQTSRSGKKTRRSYGEEADTPDAADRVRQHLSYRLGQTMIQRSRSLGGWIGMPFSLARTAREYRRDQASNANQPKPTFNSPQDKKRAEEIKQHLSYRLGSTLIAHGRSPIGWVKLPFALRREVKAFRQRQTA